ncbi:AbrB/MazE/SpoVT family DNA-binding domain-containing protein [Natrarchaeobius oligotrophus]|uniref:AbrB/MazE/SpoVT family DNA-binding domain-containing protein n=1 Tax=Natrarchaeobius chitinivorans TaxID=1679083 RepID=A0A3N6M7L0_NATCH|nr:AbrB/MazE/SpoVT family DNA-binding domain-containing protein [Natrarchaeobius chitinivorans]RQG99628.1 AbrB/MazE/SpoVT family DNA-binding domain-containing protein [Natrarchaeobius chitinivorans]
MGTETDERGRLYLSKDIRDRYGERFHVVEYSDHVELIPIDDDPLQGLRDAVGDALEGKSIEELRDEARELARREAEDGVRRD